MIHTIAAMLAPAPPSAGLLSVLADEVAAVRAMIAAETAWPTREEQRAQLARAAALAEELAALLAQPAVAVRYLYDSPRDAARTAVLGAVPVIASAAREEAAAIRSGKGRDASYPAADGLDARGICAWRAARLWWAMRGEKPGAYSKPLHQLCAAMWNAAGGARRGHQGGETSWTAHVKSALPRLHQRDADEGAAWVRTRDLTEGNRPMGG